MRTSRSSFLIVPLLAATACASSGAADTLGARGDVAPTQPRATATTPPSWTGYHGGGAHLGYSSTTPAVTTLRRAWTHALDGKVYGSPLVIGNRVIAATENNTVYALDRSTGKVLWSRHLAIPARLSHLPCGNIDPLGITGTPVFDPATQRIFAVTTAASGGSLAHRLWGLALATGNPEVRGVSADVPGQDPLVENQRGALALSRGRVLIPYGGHAGDCGSYHGYLVSTTTAGTDKRIFRTGTQREAGMWQAAGAAVNPTTGTAYVVSGNGSATTGPW
ncbi:MAG: PQQ-binding-like beta-propeller repeat protein, partial [Pseudorhodobacter sp.]|nr:PQQ-binding-like beta-propeller repeat protein [Frankiaceae bacterium]